LIKELGVKERQANEVNRNELVEIMPQITSLSSEENKWESDISVTRDRLQRAQNVANDPQDQLNQAEERVTRLETELENSRRYSNFTVK
jgi:predicted  nucleic acid-binding Zn-ribbon protein